MERQHLHRLRIHHAAVVPRPDAQRAAADGFFDQNRDKRKRSGAAAGKLGEVGRFEAVSFCFG